MPLFRRTPKTRMSPESVWSDFLLTHLLPSDPVLVAVWPVYCAAIVQDIAERAPLINAVDFESIQDELSGVRLEVCLQAWYHSFPDIAFSVSATVYTKRFLIDREFNGLWDIITYYSNATGDAIVWHRSPSEIGESNQILATSFEQAMRYTDDGDTAARVAARVPTLRVWKKNIAPVIFSMRFFQKFGLELDPDAATPLVSAVAGMYNGAIEEFDKIKRQVELER